MIPRASNAWLIRAARSADPMPTNRKLPYDGSGREPQRAQAGVDQAAFGGDLGDPAGQVPLGVGEAGDRGRLGQPVDIERVAHPARAA